jgi:hypothetical protein
LLAVHSPQVQVQLLVWIFTMRVAMLVGERRLVPRERGRAEDAFKGPKRPTSKRR